jgi:hypothetical protein
MAESDPTASEAGDQPAIIEIECGNIRFAAHHAFNALELTVTDPSEKGF